MASPPDLEETTMIAVTSTSTRRAASPAALIALAALAALLAHAQPARAQYFGQNKVQYHDFDFEVLRTEHFDIYHYPAEAEAVRTAGRLAERWYVRLSRILDLEFRRRQPLILYASHPHFEQTDAIPGFLGIGTGGVTEQLKRRVVMPFAAGLRETDHVLGHELVHAFQYAIRERGARRLTMLPLWFIEGMAEYLSLGPVDTPTAMWLRDAAATESLPALTALASGRYFPYRWGHAVWAYVAGRWGDEAIGRILRSAGNTGDAIGAIESVTGLSADAFTEQWHDEIRQWAAPWLKRGDDAGRGTAVITESGSGGSLNVGPALSPDGRRLAFLSERDLFSIDVFVADADSGAIIDTLVETATDPHFDNLQFIASAGAWSPDGRRFAIAAVSDGEPVLTIMDVERRERTREIELPDLGEAFTPTWSPDGRRIAFSALHDGFTDLFVYDLETGNLRQLTSDAFADLHPAWSPDGGVIAFTTDRFGSDLATLDLGEYRLGLLDVTSGSIAMVPTFERGHQIDPAWSADGEHIFFVADPDGIANVYRVTPATGRLAHLTDVDTGVSGITATSPALTSASAADRLAFSVFRDGRHEIVTVDPGATALDDVAIGTRRAAMLPPPRRGRDLVASALAEPTLGLPSTDGFERDDYDAGLQLDYVGQPYAMAGSDSFGSFVGGGISFLFSDMLGEHTLGAVVEIDATEGIDGVGGQVGYVNRASRWNWGVTAEQIPFVTGTFVQGTAIVGDEPAILEEQVERRQTYRQLTGLAAYPFDRAHRLELSAGYHQIGFDQTVQAQAFSLRTGALIAEQTTEAPTPDDVRFGEVGAAFVQDSSVFGPTGPLMGQRYRLDVATAAGDLTFTTLQADYRRYFVPARPVTIAARVLHAGRYGSDASDGRLTPMFLGYQNLVRGYEFSSFTADECRIVPGSPCAILDQLIGTRMLVTNLELRVPLMGAFTGEFDYGPLPIDAIVFADGGVAWTAGTGPTERPFFESVGAGVRVNLLGSAIMEIGAVRPLSRPAKGWMFGFALRPGF